MIDSTSRGVIEGIERGVARGPGEKSRRLKKRLSAGVEGGGGNLDGGAFFGDAERLRWWEGVVGFWFCACEMASNWVVKSRRKPEVWLWPSGGTVAWALGVTSGEEKGILPREPVRGVGVAAMEVV